MKSDGLYHTRKRVRYRFTGKGVMDNIFKGSSLGKTYYSYDLQARQTTMSADSPLFLFLRHHARLSQRDAKSRKAFKNVKTVFLRDAGNIFDTYKETVKNSHSSVRLVKQVTLDLVRIYTGPVFAKVASNLVGTRHFPVIAPVDEFKLISMGATAISRTIPTNPTAGLATLLGELKEGIPSIPGRALFRSGLRDYRKVGDEYLNVEFGIKPLINDVKKIASTVQLSDKIIAQYTRDSGRPIRRKLTFPETRTVTTVVDQPTWALSPANDCTAGTGVLYKETTVTTQYSFSACYTYYLDPGVTALGRLRRQEQLAAKLLGTRINPEVLWELAPWSWAVDWVSNVGDVVTNISALSNDSLVIRWAYIMCHETVTDVYTLICPLGTFTQSFSVERKTRRKATPYGFGLNIAAFTPRQWAIIGALGISKGPRQL